MPLQRSPQTSLGSSNLTDVLERVLDKGIVIAGDVKVQIADIDLLTIKIRLLIASVDKAKEIGIDWWERDSNLASQVRAAELEADNRDLRERLTQLEGRPAADVGHQSSIVGSERVTAAPPPSASPMTA